MWHSWRRCALDNVLVPDKVEVGKVHSDLQEAGEAAADLFGTLVGMDGYCASMDLNMEPGISKVRLDITLIRRADGSPS